MVSLSGFAFLIDNICERMSVRLDVKCFARACAISVSRTAVLRIPSAAMIALKTLGIAIPQYNKAGRSQKGAIATTEFSGIAVCTALM
jgi:hypothetical protein